MKNRLGKESFLPSPAIRIALIWAAGTMLFLVPIWFNTSHLRAFADPKTAVIFLFSEIIFVIWVCLAFAHKEYRPKKNILLLVVTLFIFVLTLASILGIDPNTSFWSSLDRGTGMITYFHLFGLFLALSSVLVKEDIPRLMRFAVWGGAIAAVSIILGPTGFKMYANSAGFAVYGGGGFLGNSTLASLYFSFILFWAIYLAWFEREAVWKFIYGVLAFIILATPLYINYDFLRGVSSFSWTSLLGQARAGTLALGGAFALGLSLYFFFKPGWKKILGAMLLLFQVGLLAYVVFGLATPGSLVHQKFGEYAGETRYLFWDVAGEAIKERPILGYGQDSFFFVFQKNLPEEVYEEKYHGEIFVDRPHNTLIEQAVNGGIATLILYLSIYIYAFYLLLKQYRQSQISGSLVLALGLPIYVYFLQNLFAFDVSFTLLPFFLALAFLTVTEGERRLWGGTREIKSWLVPAVALVIFIFSIQYFVGVPAKLSRAYEGVRTSPVPMRLPFYESINSSPMDSVFDLTVFGQKFYQSYSGYFAMVRPQSEKEAAQKDIESFLKIIDRITHGREEHIIHLRNIRDQFKELSGNLN